MTALLAVIALAAAAESWDIELAPRSEPGERLVVMGHVRKEKDAKPLAGAHVYAYHADGRGYYQNPGHEKEPPRLAGTAVTNAKGEYRIRTIMPGAYGGGPAHVHFEVWGEGMKRRAFVMNLALPTPAPPETGSAVHRALEQALDQPRSFGTYPLTRGKDGVLYGAFDLVWQNGFTIPGAK